MNPPYVLVTGSSTGIGKACALHLAKNGFSVLAGIRRPEDAQKLEMIAGSNLTGLQLDIADPESVTAAAAKITEITGDSGLAGLVNNAGISVHGPVEFLSQADWRRQFEVNLFGQAHITQALLPLLRRHVANTGFGSARILFIGSIAGRISMPILTPYCASKHAIAALAAGLRMELKPQGIHVCLIEPGAIQSEIWRKGTEHAETIPASDPARELYGQEIDAVLRSSQNSAANAIPADYVAKLVHHCMTSSNPPRRKVVGRDATVAAILRRILPEKWFDKIILMSMTKAK
jgi:NAD(P)-dependent dehydrogenase (short-subunit alcohol dehydrogenase family)